MRTSFAAAPLLDQPALGGLRSGSPGNMQFADDGSVTRFPAHKLGVPIDRGTVNLLRGDTVLASGRGGQEIQGAWYVDELKAAVVLMHSPGSETCGPDPYVDLAILRAP